MTKCIDLTGQTFNRLTVIKRVENNDRGESQWLCQCNCKDKNEIIVIGNNLRSGNTKSCGCIIKENAIKLVENNKKYNTYDLSGEYGIGYASNTNIPFYFDLEDYDKIKDYCWQENKKGYIYTNLNNKYISMHRLIMNPPNDMEIDHRNRKKNNNRKENLRIVTSQNNSINIGVRSNNTSGTTGVIWNKTNRKWRARIRINNKDKFLGYFENIDDAIKVRLQAEKEYFGEFAPQQHLYAEYGII